MDKIIECTYWVDNKCTACEAFKDKKECDNISCMHYHPLYIGKDIYYILSKIYNDHKKLPDSLINDFKFLAGHDCQEFFDYSYWEWAVCEYILIIRLSKYSKIGKYIQADSFLDTIELMNKYGFKIPKRVWKKYKRLKRKDTRDKIGTLNMKKKGKVSFRV